MIKFQMLSQKKRKAESNIALINIIFLMLIFFMLVGRIGTPLKDEIEIALTHHAPPSHFQQALIIPEENIFYFQGEKISLEDYWLKFQNIENSISQNSLHKKENKMYIIVEKRLGAHHLLDVIARLRHMGASSIAIITQKEN